MSSTTAKETADVDRPETLLLIGSASRELFKEEDGGTAFDVRHLKKSIDSPPSTYNLALQSELCPRSVNDRRIEYLAQRKLDFF
jgi:hypothetical protein